MKKLDYEVLKLSIEKKLNDYNSVVLSTSYNNRVTSRTMSYINDGLDFIFLTSIRSTKCKQIDKNPYVSLCLDNIQIEGIATIIGHPSQKENKITKKIFSEKHIDFYKRFAHFKVAVFIKVESSIIKKWNLTLKDSFDFLDIRKKEAYSKR